MMTIEEFTKKLYAEVEKRLVTAIEKIDGRVPTNEEVAEYGHRKIYPDGKQEYTWRGTLILTVHPLAWKEETRSFHRKIDGY